MKERRYKDRYRLETRVDPKTGRERRVAKYDGEYYRFPAGSPGARARALRPGVGMGLYWLLALAFLKTGRAATRCLYALPPFLIGLIPGVYALMGLWAMARAPQRMTVVQRENGVGRVTRSALACAVFSGIGALGCIVFLSVSGQWAAGWHEAPLSALACAAACFAFAHSRSSYRALEEEAALYN